MSIPSYRYVNGLNHQYGYTNQNPLIYADPTGEASVTISLYAGYGGSLTIGVDPRSGKPFFGVVAGWGAGGGISFDPLGGTPDDCGEDYFGLVGTFGVTAANASAGLDGNAGFSGEGPDFQAGATPYLSTEGKAGLKAEASAGLGAFFSF